MYSSFYCFQRAKAYREEGISALDEARRLERERTEHASDLAQRLLHLKQREDRLAEVTSNKPASLTY